jgi:DNA-binding response OmpR family regulator
VDIGRREASVDGRLIKLTNREVRVLAVLAADPGRILKHGDIIAQAWGRIDAVNVDYLRVCIMSLRSKLGEGAGLIVTHSGIGYSIAE